MFSDKTADPIDISSTWKKKARTEDQLCQTASYKVISRQIQTKHRATVEVQTDDFMYVPEDIRLDYQEKDLRHVAKHLRRITPFLCLQLERNSRSRAFDHYRPYLRDSTFQKKVTDATLQNTFKIKEFVESNLGITALSWNCNGTVVAAAYGDHRHEDWCFHSSGVALYNISKSRPDQSDPDYLFDLQSCALSLQFHPTIPSLIAAGGFNGELTVWDLSNEGTDFTIAQSNSNQSLSKDDGENVLTQGHSEPIVSILWWSVDANASRAAVSVSSKRLRYRQRLLSVAMDGKILIWKLVPAAANKKRSKEADFDDQLPDNVELVFGYEIHAGDLPRVMRVRGRRKECLSLTCALLSPLSADDLFVACDAGVVFHCSLQEAKNDKQLTPSVGRSSPVTATLLPAGSSRRAQGCSIHAMSWFHCPENNEHYLLCTGAQGVIYWLNPSAGTALFTVEPPQSMGSCAYAYALTGESQQQWYCLGGDSGTVWFWRNCPAVSYANGDNQLTLPWLQIDSRGRARLYEKDDENDRKEEDEKSIGAVWSIASNQQNSLFTAVGYSNGNVQIWDLSKAAIG